MAFHHHVVMFGKVHELIDCAPVVLSFSWVEKRPFHFILGGEAVELFGKDGREAGVV